jgi:exodeoxyribonuclease V alpha subunit
MLDLVLFNKLLECFNHDTRIILIGDVHQLPSVGAGSVLEDLILSNRVDVNVLTDIMRQSKNSHIIKYCSKINEGTPIRQCNYDDFSYKTFEDKDILLEEFFVLYDKEVMEKGMENVQVIMPYKKGDLGVNKINNFVRDRYNDNKLDERYGYKVDDKVMQIRNNYDKEVFNGEVGVVSEINNDEDYLEVTYDKNMKVIYEIDEIDEIMLAYSCTVHKVQGSEYPTVFVLLSEENNMLHTRRVLYTACSRPRTSLYLLSMEDIVDKCIKNDYNRKRTTKLCSFLNQPNTEG